MPDQNCIFNSQNLLIVFADYILHRKTVQKFWEKGNLKHLYRNELDKVCFSHYATQTYYYK